MTDWSEQGPLGDSIRIYLKSSVFGSVSRGGCRTVICPPRVLSLPRGRPGTWCFILRKSGLRRWVGFDRSVLSRTNESLMRADRAHIITERSGTLRSSLIWESSASFNFLLNAPKSIFSIFQIDTVKTAAESKWVENNFPMSFRSVTVLFS